MEHLIQKHTTISDNLKEAMRFLTKKKENKKEKVTESLHLTVKIARRLNDNMTLASETLHKQNHCGNH